MKNKMLSKILSALIAIAVVATVSVVGVSAATSKTGSVSRTGNFSDSIKESAAFGGSKTATLAVSYGQYSSTKVSTVTTYGLSNSTGITKTAGIKWDGVNYCSYGGENDIVHQFTRTTAPNGVSKIEYYGELFNNSDSYRMSYTLTVY